MTHFSVRDEYAPRFGRQRLTLWSGAFASTFEGWAWELPGHNGFMVSLDYFRGSVKVECESPRTDANYVAVDEALSAAANTLNPPDTDDPWVHDPQRDGAGCGFCGSFAQVNSDNLCRDCHKEDTQTPTGDPVLSRVAGGPREETP